MLPAIIKEDFKKKKRKEEEKVKTCMGLEGRRKREEMGLQERDKDMRELSGGHQLENVN